MSLMKVDVCFVRHGETTANRDGRIQGHCDFPLTEKGQAHSLKLGQALRNVKWHKVYSSDLTRAVHTSELILKQSKHNYDVEITSQIREVSFGIREGQLKTLSPEAIRAAAAEKQGVAIEHVVDHAETPEEIYKRQSDFFASVMTDVQSLAVQPPEVPRILCVSHGGLIKRYLHNFTNHTLSSIDNCSITTMRVQWDSSGARTISVLESNTVAHLKDNVSEEYEHIWPTSQA